MKHLTDQQLMAYVEGTLVPKKQMIFHSHIQSCDRCHREYLVLKKLWDLGPTKEIKSETPGVYEKIMLKYDEISTRKKWYTKHFDPIETFFNSPKKIAFSTMSVAFVVVFLLFFNHSKETKFKDVKLQAIDGKGEVLLNDKKNIFPFYLSPGDRIKTGTSSEVNIVYSSRLKMFLSKGTNLSLTTSQEHVQMKKNIFNFTMNSGSLKCSFDPEHIISYSFVTPHAVIRSGGTVFNLKVHSNGTILTVQEGNLLVFAKKDANVLKVKAVKGFTYNINTNSEVRKEKTSSERTQSKKRNDKYIYQSVPKKNQFSE